MTSETPLRSARNWFSKAAATALSCLRVAWLPKAGNPDVSRSHNELVILGNGPSLRPLIEQHAGFLRGKDLLAVNYAVLSDYFEQLKPAFYLLADPLFFTDPEHRDRLFDTLVAKTRWPMHLFVSASARGHHPWKDKLKGHPHIRIHYFSMTPVEGFAWFTRLAYGRGWGMPRPRNVLIPCLMTGLRLGYPTLYLAGADHSWLKEIWVDDRNRVREDLNHFYDQNGAQDYVSTKRLHELLYSLYVAFKSYHTLRAYADSLGRKVYNITEGSYIDAFERMKIE